MEQHAAPQQPHQPQEIFSPAASASVPGAQQLQSSSPSAAVAPRLVSFPMLVGCLHHGGATGHSAPCVAQAQDLGRQA